MRQGTKQWKQNKMLSKRTSFFTFLEKKKKVSLIRKDVHIKQL